MPKRYASGTAGPRLVPFSPILNSVSPREAPLSAMAPRAQAIPSSLPLRSGYSLSAPLAAAPARRRAPICRSGSARGRSRAQVMEDKLVHGGGVDPGRRLVHG